MKNVWKISLLVLAAAGAVCGFAACNKTLEEQPKHEHTSGVYEWNETEHWKTCEGCGETLDKGKHAFTDGVCACGYSLVDDQGLVYEYEASTQSYTVTGLNKPNATAIVIPEARMNRPVAKIGEFAFSQSDLVYVSIPASITEIGVNAFAVKNAVTSMVIFDLKAWFNISFGDVFANPMCHGGALYLNGEQVTDLTVPEGVTKINDYVFAGCESITSLTVPEGVTEIGEDAFYWCKNLETVTLPASLQTVDPAAFGRCGKLSSISVAAGNANYRVENNCLVETATHTLVRGCKDAAVPAEVTKIGAYAFSGNTEMAALAIPETVTEIDRYAFFDTGLKSVVIPSKVTELKECMFLSCSELTSVQLPSGLIGVGNFAFSYCEKLQGITLPETVKTIGSEAFAETALTEITVPDSVTEIGYKAFLNCAALAKITFGNGLKKVGEDAFEGCEQLKGVYITDVAAWCGVKYNSHDLPTYPLFYAGKLYVNDVLMTELTIPASVTEILQGTFSFCKNATSIVVENGVTKIGEGAFLQCENLTSLTLPASVTRIDASLVAYCKKLEHIYFRGTRAQWDAIDKDERWDRESSEFVLHCTDDN